MSLPLRILVVLLLAFIVAPLLVPVVMSVSDTPFMTFPPRGFTLRWYERVIQNPEVQASLLVSLRLAAAATVGSLLIGIPCAIGLVRYDFAGKRAMLALILSPIVVPLLVTGLALLQAFSYAGSRWTFGHLVVGHVVVCLPYVIRNVTNSLRLADPDLENAARVLGAGPFATFRFVTWHQIRPGIVAGAIFAFIVSFDDFPISMWLADARQFPLPLFLEVAIQRFFDPSIAALSTLMILLALVLILAMETVLGIRVRRFATSS